ncbi:hypothetical protein HRG_002548 [Hirsutella rhossiliensis]
MRVHPESWVPWADFNYATLTQVFHEELKSTYTGSKDPKPLILDVTVHNEETLDDYLRRFMIPTVNYALAGQAGQAHFGRGSRCGGNYIPDWSVVSDKHLHEELGAYVNLLPGDTKLSAKWAPEMLSNDEYYDEWAKVVSQVLTYMDYYGVRYGFILTDTYLVPLRLTRRPIGTGISQGRPQRSLASYTAGHYRHSSDTSMTSGIAATNSSYLDDNATDWDYHDPEYALVPWQAHGERLTVKLALWFLAMMAERGDNYIDYSYPGLDTWRSRGPGGFIHNVSGRKKQTLNRRDTRQEPDPQGPQREQAASDTSAGDSQVESPGQYVLPIRASVPEDASQAGSSFQTEGGYEKSGKSHCYWAKSFPK